MRTDKEIREWVKVQFGHLPKAEQRKIRAYTEYVRDFYGADGITPSPFGQAVMKAYPRVTHHCPSWSNPGRVD
jgi:hypothetical protein